MKMGMGSRIGYAAALPMRKRAFVTRAFDSCRDMPSFPIQSSRPLRTAAAGMGSWQQKRWARRDSNNNNLNKGSWWEWLSHMGAPDHNGDLMGRTFIGEDDVGNRYYEVPNPGRKPNPKREVHYSEKDPLKVEWYDVPPLWRLWCTHMRKNPPTHEEVIQSRKERSLTIARGKELEKEDKRQRNKQQTEKMMQADAPPDEPEWMKMAGIPEQRAMYDEPLKHGGPDVGDKTRMKKEKRPL